MFTGSAIPSLVAHLNRRQASLWHACQLIDFAAYLALGGIPARSLVERRGLSQTAFATDAVDRRNGVWDKVFCNLDDFGRSFGAGRRAVPNPYGPVVFQIRPDALLEASDVALTLRSAGAHDFDREGESLTSVDEVDLLYRQPASAGFPLSAETRYGEELRQAFSGSQIEAKSAELSITLDAEMLPIADVSMVCVEPLEFEGVQLADVVHGLTREFQTPLSVRTRAMHERRAVWSDLVRVLADGPIPFALVFGRADVGDATRVWLDAVPERGLDWQFDRFASYLYHGTLRPMQGVAPALDGGSPVHVNSASTSSFRRLG